MARKNKKAFQKKTFRLKDDHTWQAPKGYKILVVERGLVSFNIPEDWLLAKFEPLELHDKAPPDDNARLSMSFWRLPPGVDWTDLPLAPMLSQAAEGGTLQILARSAVAKVARTDLEMVWLEHRFLDPVEKREAFTRMALARGWDVQALLTFDYWVDDAEKFLPVWEEALRSLQLGRSIEDPTKGAVLH